jgi:glycosyltransferase involved in cell wall biosynthesis
VNEVVRSGVDGIEVEPTAQALASAIQDLLTNRPRRDLMGRHALERAGEFDWNRIAEDFERIAMMAGIPNDEPR